MKNGDYNTFAVFQNVTYWTVNKLMRLMQFRSFLFLNNAIYKTDATIDEVKLCKGASINYVTG